MIESTKKLKADIRLVLRPYAVTLREQSEGRG